MNGQLLVSLKEDFARSAELRRDEWREKQIRFTEQERRRRLDEALEDKREAEESEMLTEFVLATEAQVQAFTVKLDAYDTATVTALMENQEALELVRERMKAMLEKAYVLPDGRRVFKTEDGTRVFDEGGAEVRNVNPDAIENWRPKWEQIAGEKASEGALLRERQELTVYQEKLDAARERTAEKGLTEIELKDLEKTLAADMPERVRTHVTDVDAPSISREQSPTIAQPALRSGVRMDMPSL